VLRALRVELVAARQEGIVEIEGDPHDGATVDVPTIFRRLWRLAMEMVKVSSEAELGIPPGSSTPASAISNRSSGRLSNGWAARSDVCGIVVAVED